MTLFDDLAQDAGAEFDETRAYRYHLWRTWAPGDRRVLWVMLNPSTADEHENDPTIRRCINFSKAWRFDGLDICNLFALRSTSPDAMKQHAQPLGDAGVNDRKILDLADRAALIIAAWGNDGAHWHRGNAVMASLTIIGEHQVHCLGTTDSGHPLHPLYLSAARRPVPFSYSR